MKKALAVLITLVVVVGALTVINYNTLVSLEEDVHNKWSMVENNYQRRADLIPNLVNTVKGVAKQENELFTNIARLRSGYSDANTPEEYAKLDSDLKAAINLTVEAYPELKSNENFLKLQDELEGSENRIAIARKDYNDSVATFNKKIRRFPANLFASAFGFERVEFFESVQGAEQAPAVNFGN